MDDLLLRGTLSLAYLGDSVYELYVRHMLISAHDYTNNALHSAALKYVSAKGQAAAVKAILPGLDESEAEIYRRGRNSHPKTVSKHNDPGEYSAATGLEALFGWLYLSGKEERTKELLELCVKAIDNAGELTKKENIKADEI